jgi:hypothetical protein
MNTNINFWLYLAHFSLEWKTFQTKVVEKVKTQFYIQYFFLKNRAFYEIMWKIIVEGVMPRLTTWHMRIACWITKDTNTQTQVV